MSRYGISRYGINYYGPDNPIEFDASPFTATPYNHGEIFLEWTNPTGEWSRFVVVRNPYGYPLNPWDGDQIVSVYRDNNPLTYLDTDLIQGQYYYYSIFAYSTSSYEWINAGRAMGLSVRNFGNIVNLYNYLPNIYKITQPYVATTSNWENSDLYKFLSNFGFELDYDQTMISLLKGKYNTQKVNGKLIPLMMNQFGRIYEPAIGLQQNRRLLRDAITLTKQKGSKEGLIGFLKDFTSWAVPEVLDQTPNPSVNGITVGHNLMLDYNDSSFEESNGHWESTDGTAQLDHLKVLRINQLELTSNVATLYIGSHNYDIGNDVLISQLPFPLFNSAIPYTLTDVNQTLGTISFSLTSPDIPLTSGYNVSIQEWGTVTPSPAPWEEPTAPFLFPNKTDGILSLYNAADTTQTINAYAGDSDPIQKGIPVTAGLDYSFSIYASKGGFTARNITAKIKWFDRFGVLISTSSGTPVLDDIVYFDDSVRPYVTDTAPADAYYACPGLSIEDIDGYSTLEHHYFDAAQFEQSATVTEFDEARQIHLVLRANRINELINPNFVAPLDPWSVTNATISSTTEFQSPTAEVFNIVSASITSNVATVELDNYHSYQVGQTIYISGVTGPNAGDYNGTRTIAVLGTKSFGYSVTASDSSVSSGKVYASNTGALLTSTDGLATISSWDGVTTSQLMGIYYPNTSYTFSAYIYGLTEPDRITASITWYDINYVPISTQTNVSLVITVGDWIRTSVTSEAPGDAAYASVHMDWDSSIGNQIIVDMALFENAGLALDYFDGGEGPATAYDLLWENNVPNTSRSHLYKNRLSIETRLITDTLQTELPLGSTAAIYIAQPRT